MSQVANNENELWSILRSLEEIEKPSDQLATLNSAQNPTIAVSNFKQIAS